MKSVLLSPEELKELRRLLTEKKVSEIDVKSPHEIYRFDDKICGIFLVGYRSGNLVYKEGDAVKEILKDFLSEDDEYDYIVGTDEAGKGEWYGPLVVACVALKPNEIPIMRNMGVRDSKKLGRETLLKIGKDLSEGEKIKEVRVLSPEEYNKVYGEYSKNGKNLNDLMAQMHTDLIKKVLSELEYKKAKVVIDMFDYKKTEKLLRDLPKENLLIIQKTGGESETSVAAASILAKYLFEKEVDRLEKDHKIRIRGVKPKNIPKDLLSMVAKTHFKNVSSGRQI
jgi:ribonuclease HIII